MFYNNKETGFKTIHKEKNLPEEDVEKNFFDVSFNFEMAVKAIQNMELTRQSLVRLKLPSVIEDSGPKKKKGYAGVSVEENKKILLHFK